MAYQMALDLNEDQTQVETNILHLMKALQHLWDRLYSKVPTEQREEIEGLLMRYDIFGVTTLLDNDEYLIANNALKSLRYYLAINSRVR